VKEEIPVPFPKPRTFDVVTNRAFVDIKEHVLHLIREELTTMGPRGDNGRTEP
jgi:hypothetical protein